jgi:predicted RNA-binding protein associated with RNAse of E/G family
MSDTQTPVAATAVTVQKLNAIQLIEQELAGFFKQAEVAAKQAEQAVANVHAIQGAIQGTNLLLSKLKTAALEAETEAKKLVGDVEAGIHIVEEKL